MGLIGIDPTGFIPEPIKRRFYDFTIDAFAKLLGRWPKKAELARTFRSDAGLRAEVDAALERAARRFVDEYAEVDGEVSVALMRPPTRFLEAPLVQEALAKMARRPGTYLDPERHVVEGVFTSVLPGFDPDRVNRAVAHFLSRVAEEVMSIPQLAPIYAVQLQKLSLEQGREMVAALRDLQADQRQFFLTMLEVVARYPPLPAGMQPSLPEVPEVLHKLPQPDYIHFVGREQELARVHELLSPANRAWVVTIDGIGGIGKSALALEVALRYLRDYDQLPPEERFKAIIWTSAKTVALTADGIGHRQQITRTLEDIYTTIADTLGREDITQARPEEQGALVTKALTGQRTLLIVDNLETIDDERVNAFLRELPVPTKAIVTTRHRIDVAYPVRLIGMPKVDGLALIAQEGEKKGVALTEAEAKKVFDRTGGVPVAIVWSIAQMGYGYGIEAVLRRLSQPTEEAIGRYCFAAALDLIRDTDAYILLMALSIFHKDACREALGTVAALAGRVLDSDEGLVTLERLSLINKRGDRFRMLPLTRNYAAELLAQEPELETALRHRWTGYYVQLLHRFEVGYEGAVDNRSDDYDSVVAELDNILAVLEWCYSTQRWSQVAKSVHLLCYLLYLRGLWAEREHWIELGGEAAHRSGDQLTEGLLLCDRAWVLSRQGRHRDVREVLRGARAIAQDIDSDLLLRYVLLLEGDSARRQGLYELALERFAEASEGCGGEMERHLARLDYYIGQVEYDRDRLEEAELRFQAVMEQAQRLRWDRAIAHTYLQLGQVALGRNDVARAWEMLHEQALPTLEQWQDEYELASCELLIGEVAEKKGKTSEAVSWTAEAYRVFKNQERSDDIERAREQLRRLGVSDEEIEALGVSAPRVDRE